MSSGSYFPAACAARQYTERKNWRKLGRFGIPTVADKIAQMIVERYLEPILEPVFHTNSRVSSG